jgi:hypothetical protein
MTCSALPSSNAEGSASVRSERPARRRWLLLVLALTMSSLAVTLTSPRVFDERVLLDPVTTGSGAGKVVRNAVQALTLLIVLTVAVWALLQRRDHRWMRHPRVLLGLLALPVSVLPSYAFGVEPSSRNLLNICGTIVLLVAAYHMPPVDVAWFVRLLRRALLVFLYGSLAAAVISPAWALETGYDQGYFVAVPVRLHGLASHANALAPLAALYLLTARWHAARLPFEALHLTAAFLVVGLSQSKTVWIGLAIAWLVLRLHRLAPQQRPSLAMAAALTLLVSPLLLLLWISIPQLLSFVVSSYDPENSTLTLTGRIPIWIFTVMAWQDGITFGYGPELWGEEMQLQYFPALGWYVPQAHSFYFQMLGQAGLVGLAGAVVCVVTIVRVAWWSRHRQAGLLLGISTFLLVRTLTEPTFVNRPLFAPDTFLFLVTLTVAVGAGGVVSRHYGAAGRRRKSHA